MDVYEYENRWGQTITAKLSEKDAKRLGAKKVNSGTTAQTKRRAAKNKAVEPDQENG